MGVVGCCKYPKKKKKKKKKICVSTHYQACKFKNFIFPFPCPRITVYRVVYHLAVTCIAATTNPKGKVNRFVTRSPSWRGVACGGLDRCLHVAVLLGRDQTHCLQDMMRCRVDTKHEHECRHNWGRRCAGPTWRSLSLPFGLYNLEVRRRAKTALSDNIRVFDEPLDHFHLPPAVANTGRLSSSLGESASHLAKTLPFSLLDLHRYFIMGIGCICWE